MESIDNRLYEIGVTLAKIEAHNLELRDKFAIAALIGMLAGRAREDRTGYCSMAYEFADEMLKERIK